MHKQQIASLAVLTVALLGATACSKQESAAQTAAPPPAPASPSAQTGEELGQPADPRFIGKIWASTTPGHARGSLMIFLPDRSLLMDSCFETYRISQWGAEGDRIRWIEDAIPIEATISMPNENELRLQLAGQDRVQSYVTATVPYVCPDMPR
jgi:glyoxylase-like metal-dependent hydrolase (beta-lactamase superfamily II)